MKRLSDKEVKENIEKFGFKLLKRFYENKFHYVVLKCPNGHEYKTLYNNWQKGSRCPYCNGQSHYRWSTIKKEFEKEKYKIITEKYEGVNSWIEIVCPNGKYNKIKYRNWIKGIRCDCLECNKNKKYFCHIYAPYEIYEITNKRNYKINKRKNGILWLTCPEGHEIKMYQGNFLKGHGCKYCIWENKRGFKKLSDISLYKKLVRTESEKNYKKYHKKINPKNLKRKRGHFSLDHKFSINEGFKNNIPIHVISSKYNLELIPQEENLKKNNRCSIKKEKLFDLYFGENKWH